MKYKHLECLIHVDDGITYRKLSEKCDKWYANMFTKIVKDWIKNGIVFVVKEKNTNHIKLTDKGRRLKELSLEIESL